jgi:hypothetical protein
MNLIEMLMSSGGDAAVERLGSRFGLDESQTKSALQHLVPALGNGLQRNVASEGGVDRLMGALSDGNHGQYIDNPDLLNQEETTQTGNGILAHLLGSKDASREVAANASAQTGIGVDTLKQMLPLVATMVMGSLSKRTDQSGYLAGPGSPAQPEGFLSMLTPLLDTNRDGSVADDVLGMIGRYMRNR